MLDITKPIILNVARQNNQTIVFGKQGDFRSRFISCTLVDAYNNPIYFKPHHVATINAKRGTEAKSFLCEILGDGTIKAPLTTWMLQSEGTLKCEIAVFTSDNERLASASFTINVQEAVYLGDELTPDENYNLFRALLADVSVAKESAMDIALESKSWAIGSTGIREGENENNAKYFKEGAEQYANIAANNLLNGVNEHNISHSSHEDIRDNLRQVEAIARGKAKAYVFDTKEHMEIWLGNANNVSLLEVGDNLYIRDVLEKDYWWDGSSPKELEAEAPDLTNYYTREQVEALLPKLVTRAEYDALLREGRVEAGRLYDIIEEN